MDKSLNLYYSRDCVVDHAYIITVKGNESSENYSARCRSSCEQVGMPYKDWDAFDGTDNSTIKIPDHSANSSYLKWLKVFDHHLSKTEIACYLSHFSLWCRCLELDKPSSAIKNVPTFSSLSN